MLRTRLYRAARTADSGGDLPVGVPLLPFFALTQSCENGDCKGAATRITITEVSAAQLRQVDQKPLLGSLNGQISLIPQVQGQVGSSSERLENSM